MTGARTTIVVVPRERFAFAADSLESIIATAGSQHALIYVEAGSPPAVARRLADAARRHDFTLIRTDRYLTPNQARNLALPMLTTKYVAFLDNDLVGMPGWLAAMENCAEETDAAIVAPLICIGRPVHTTIHHAGGTMRFVERDGKRLFEERHNLNWKPLEANRDKLARGATDMAEFHCVLVRTEVFARHGKLDEELMSTHEHIDLCLDVARAGGKILFEPTAIVTYLPAKLKLNELPYFMLRWSDEWSRHTVSRFNTKWNAGDVHDQDHTARFVWYHRGHGLPKLRKGALATAGWRLGNRIIDAVENTLANVARRRFPGVGREVPVSVVHAPRPRAIL
jgi:GT2 family glycosyltransferase